MPQRSDYRATHPAESGHKETRRGHDGEHEAGEGGDRYPDQESRAGGAGQIVERYPYASLMTSVGLGFGFGLALTMLIPRRRPSWYEEYLPESVQHLPERLKRVPDTISSYLPSSWKHS